MNKFTRLLAVTGVTGALALSGGGIAAAATAAGSPQQSPDRAATVAMKDHSGKDHGRGKDHGSGKDQGKSRDQGKNRDRNSKR
ncbi:MAG: hypothetical protein JST08_06455 [Actinobacteria bacterium]|nr:hypothetical protein [Actinomycetota bacterium]